VRGVVAPHLCLSCHRSLDAGGAAGGEDVGEEGDRQDVTQREGQGSGGGFMAVHAGEIPVEKIAEQLGSFLSNFDSIAETYRRWTEEKFVPDQMEKVNPSFPEASRPMIEQDVRTSKVETVYSAYNVATNYATHRTRSVRTAFDLLERINRAFQQQFPAAN